MMRRTDSRGAALASRTLAAVALALLCGLASRAAAQDSGVEKKQNIRRLLELTKAAELGAQFIGPTVAQLKTNLERLPPDERVHLTPEKVQRILSVFEEELHKEFAPEKIMEAIGPVYEKYLSGEEVKGLIVFYESPLGRKVTDVMPQITREALEIGVGIGRRVGTRVIEKLQAEGTLPGAGVPPPAPKPQP